MPVDYKALGSRIAHYRGKLNLSQEDLAEQVSLSREYINKIETAARKPTLDTLIDIANVLHVSADDILVDSLQHTVSTADSDLHRLLLDCNKVEEQILTKNAQELKKILYGLGI